MKVVRLFALLLILAGLVASASAHSFDLTTGLLCGSSTDPTLCDQTTGDDTGCSSFCDASCSGFTNVSDACVARFGGGYKCVCHGTPVP
jgi:hypothetical protein